MDKDTQQRLNQVNAKIKHQHKYAKRISLIIILSATLYILILSHKLWLGLKVIGTLLAIIFGLLCWLIAYIDYDAFRHRSARYMYQWLHDGVSFRYNWRVHGYVLYRLLRIILINIVGLLILSPLAWFLFHAFTTDNTSSTILTIFTAIEVLPILLLIDSEWNEIKKPLPLEQYSQLDCFPDDEYEKIGDYNMVITLNQLFAVLRMPPKD